MYNSIMVFPKTPLQGLREVTKLFGYDVDGSSSSLIHFSSDQTVVNEPFFVDFLGGAPLLFKLAKKPFCSLLFLFIGTVKLGYIL